MFYNLWSVKERVQVLHRGVSEAISGNEDEQKGAEDGEVKCTAHHEAHLDLDVGPRLIVLLNIHCREDHVLETLPSRLQVNRVDIDRDLSSSAHEVVEQHEDNVEAENPACKLQSVFQSSFLKN